MGSELKLHWISLVGAVGFLLITAATVPSPTPYTWKLPKGFPQPHVPADNPMTVEKVELGRHLFYDTRLSGNGMMSCATCHRQNRAFGDDTPTTPGTFGDPGFRKSMAIVNVAYTATLTWSNPEKRLENQALVPLFGTHPIEMGLDKDNSFLEDLIADPVYKKLFRAAFPNEKKPFNVANVTKSLASFQRTLISGNSPYDRYRYHGDEQATTELAKRGEELFFSGKMGCGRCHGGFNFSDATITAKNPVRAVFHNTGLYNVKGPTHYPAPNVGLYEHTKSKYDIGLFKAPTLRNIALHPPYMHDGSVPTLDAVLDHYAAGGRTIKSGPRAGVGKDNPNKDHMLNGFEMTKEERSALLAFLHSLTDREFMTNPAFSDPWPK